MGADNVNKSDKDTSVLSEWGPGVEVNILSLKHQPGPMV